MEPTVQKLQEVSGVKPTGMKSLLCRIFGNHNICIWEPRCHFFRCECGSKWNMGIKVNGQWNYDSVHRRRFPS